MDKQRVIATCHELLIAYKNGQLGQTVMPEDTNPGVADMDFESRISYFTLPMALNYQRDSYKLWKAALKTFQDPDTRFVFDVERAARASVDDLRVALMKYKLALQPNKHVHTWQTIAKTVYENWGAFTQLLEMTRGDFLVLRQVVRVDFKKGFPYLSGPKIFNYWSFILSTYGGVVLDNRDQIDIAPDTHITQCSVKLGIITQVESLSMTKDEISTRWREILVGSDIDPIDMHAPLWFWSRNGFLYVLS